MNTVTIISALCTCITCFHPFTHWTTAENPPCFLNDSENALVSETLEQSLEKVITRMTVLTHHVESHIQNMKDFYCVNESVEGKATASFLDNNITNAEHISDFCDNSNTFLVIMECTYEMMNQLAGHFQNLRHTATGEDSLKRLIDTQADIYDVMCSIKIAMKSKGQAPESIVPSENLSVSFLQYRKEPVSRCTQQTTEYVTMLDTLKVTEHLNTLIGSLL